MIFDISPTLHPGVATWPGDVAFSRSNTLRIADGCSVNLSSLRMSLHTGAHADAPAHFQDGAATIDEVDLRAYWGPARLVTLTGSGAITAGDLEACLATGPERVLLRCHRQFDPDQFPTRIRYFDPAAARLIAEAGVLLVGVDAPSVDPLDSKRLSAHHVFARGGVAILENLVLRGVPDGEYELAALPLKIAGGDAAPVRAALSRSDGVKS